MNADSTTRSPKPKASGTTAPKLRTAAPKSSGVRMSKSHGSADQLAPSLVNDAPRVSRLPIILGIDPGTRVLGYGAVVVGARGPRLLAAGVLRTERGDDIPARLGWLRRELDQLFARLNPTAIVVEQAFASRNMQSALRIGEGRGVVLACASVFGAEIAQYPPASAKKALVGSGAADKTQVARMVEQVLGIAKLDLPLDASDALALALAHIQRSSTIR